VFGGNVLISSETLASWAERRCWCLSSSYTCPRKLPAGAPVPLFVRTEAAAGPTPPSPVGALNGHAAAHKRRMMWYPASPRFSNRRLTGRPLCGRI